MEEHYASVLEKDFSNPSNHTPTLPDNLLQKMTVPRGFRKAPGMQAFLHTFTTIEDAQNFVDGKRKRFQLHAGVQDDVDQVEDAIDFWAAKLYEAVIYMPVGGDQSQVKRALSLMKTSDFSQEFIEARCILAVKEVIRLHRISDGMHTHAYMKGKAESITASVRLATLVEKFLSNKGLVRDFLEGTKELRVIHEPEQADIRSKNNKKSNLAKAEKTKALKKGQNPEDIPAKSKKKGKAAQTAEAPRGNKRKRADEGQQPIRRSKRAKALSPGDESDTIEVAHPSKRAKEPTNPPKRSNPPRRSRKPRVVHVFPEDEEEQNAIPAVSGSIKDATTVHSRASNPATGRGAVVSSKDGNPNGALLHDAYNQSHSLNHGVAIPSTAATAHNAFFANAYNQAHGGGLGQTMLGLNTIGEGYNASPYQSGSLNYEDFPLFEGLQNASLGNAHNPTMQAQTGEINHTRLSHGNGHAMHAQTTLNHGPAQATQAHNSMELGLIAFGQVTNSTGEGYDRNYMYIPHLE